MNLPRAGVGVGVGSGVWELSDSKVMTACSGDGVTKGKPLASDHPLVSTGCTLFSSEPLPPPSTLALASEAPSPR